MSDVNVGTLYDFNKAAVLNEPPLSEEQINEKISMLIAYLISTDNAYYMLLNKERSDYTMFVVDYNGKEGHISFELIQCLKNRGEIKSIERTEDGNAIECWVVIDGEAFVYYFFPYDEGVIS